MTALALTFLLCLFFSAFFSGAEMAFVSTNKFKLREMADSGNPKAKKIMRLVEAPEEFLTAVLIGNNIVDVTATSIMTYWLHAQFGISNEWLVMIVMAPVIILFGEMLPKDFCRVKGEQILLKYANVLIFFSRLFSLPAWFVMQGMNFFLRVFKANVSKSIFVSEEEFRLLIDESTQSGVIDAHEKRLIHTILDFERIEVAHVMTPLDQVPKISIMGTVGEVKAIARSQGTPMVLVYEEIPSLVMGMIYVFDLLFEEDNNRGLKEYLRSPLFISKSTSLEKAFLTLQQNRQSYAVVTDTRKDVLGAVPIEKLLAV